MWRVTADESTSHGDRLTRRSFVQAGALSASGCAFAGLNLANLSRLEAAGATSAARRDTSVILFG
jgi:hypothetical protein